MDNYRANGVLGGPSSTLKRGVFTDLGVYDMPNSYWYNISSISIICKIVNIPAYRYSEHPYTDLREKVSVHFLTLLLVLLNRLVLQQNQHRIYFVPSTSFLLFCSQTMTLKDLQRIMDRQVVCGWTILLLMFFEDEDGVVCPPLPKPQCVPAQARCFLPSSWAAPHPGLRVGSVGGAHSMHTHPHPLQACLALWTGRNLWSLSLNFPSHSEIQNPVKLPSFNHWHSETKKTFSL